MWNAHKPKPMARKKRNPDYRPTLPNGVARCQATAHRTKLQCEMPALPNTTVCRYHGGLTPSGPASPNFKHGRYSRARIPAHLADRYEFALTDQRILEIRREIAITDAKLWVDLIPQLDTGEAGSLWETLQKTWAEMLTARSAGDLKKMGEKLNVVGDLITTGASAFAAWEEAMATMEHKRKLVESERKREVQAQEMVSVMEIMALVAQTQEIILRYVRTEDRPKVARELEGLVSDGSGRAERPV